MGMSGSYGGPSGATPLVPTWLEPASVAEDPTGSPNGEETGDQGAAPAPPPPVRPPIPLPQDRTRFSTCRGNLSRFLRSGGTDRASLGRAISHYVSSASGGARNAALRMGSSRRAAGHLLGFLSDAGSRGAREALRALNLDRLAGQPIEDVFLGLADYVCPDGGTVDEGIAREAFIETIIDITDSGITDLDALSPDQIQSVFELYVTHTIEARLLNDIGNQLIVLPSDVRDVEVVQAQLRDFILRGVADALHSDTSSPLTLTADRVQGYVDQVYVQAFEVLQSLGDREATTR